MSWQSRNSPSPRPTSKFLPEHPRVWVAHTLNTGDLMNGMAIGHALTPEPHTIFVGNDVYGTAFVAPTESLSFTDAKIRLLDYNDTPDIFVDSTGGLQLGAFEAAHSDPAIRWNVDALPTRRWEEFEPTVRVRLLLPESDPFHQHKYNADVTFSYPHQQDNIRLHESPIKHVIESIPTRITPERLAQAHTQHAPALAHVVKAQHPLHVVVLGERTDKDNAKSARDNAALITQLQALVARHGGSVVLCTSPRTLHPEATMQAIADALPHGAVVGRYAYGPNQPNPYEGLLAIADTITVTNDSMSMVSDAMACPVPRFVMMREQESGGMNAQHRYAEQLIAKGAIFNLMDAAHITALPEQMESINSAPEIAAHIRAAWHQKQAQLARQHRDIER